MLRSTLLAALFLFICQLSLLGCYNARPAQDPVMDGPQMVQHLNQRTLALVMPFGHHGAFCSAVWVSPTVILTANHCIEGYAETTQQYNVFFYLKKMGISEEVAQLIATTDLQVLKDAGAPEDIIHAVEQAQELFPKASPQGLVLSYTTFTEVTDVGVQPLREHHATAYALYPGADLALLRASADAPLHEFVKLSDTDPAIGEDISTMGQGHGNWWSYRHGVVSALRQDMSHNDPTHKLKGVHGPFLQMQLMLIPGDSGGGVFNSRGQLIGINSFVDHASGFSYAVPVSTINAMMAGQKLSPVSIDPSMPDPKL